MSAVAGDGAASSMDLSLYLVLDPAMCGDAEGRGAAGMLRVVEAGIDGGVTMVQLRAADWRKRDILEAARALQALCGVRRVPFIVNDHVDVALAVGADGVHVGQSDLPAAEARRLLDRYARQPGERKIVGVSVSNAREWQAVDPAVADYVGVGPIWATATKPDAAPALGAAGLHDLLVRRQAEKWPAIPAVAIGGIHVDNARDVLATGIDGIAVVSAICASAAPKEAARALCEIIYG